MQLDGHEVYVATGGKHFDPVLPTVLFIHGSGLDHRSWALQTRWFAYNGYSVLAPDLPGHSLSAGSALKTIEAQGQWLANLLESMDVSEVHVVGHSQGFLSALELAERAPERLRSLTGIATAAAINVNPALIETAMASAHRAADMMLQWGFGQSAQMGLSAVPGMQPIAIGRNIIGTNPLVIDLQACAAYENGIRIAAQINKPTQLILADRDRMTPLAQGKALAELMHAEVVLIKGQGHMLPIEAPRQCLHLLRHFIHNLR